VGLYKRIEITLLARIRCSLKLQARAVDNLELSNTDQNTNNRRTRTQEKQELPTPLDPSSSFHNGRTSHFPELSL
jgi:hypothetical protein